MKALNSIYRCPLQGHVQALAGGVEFGLFQSVMGRQVFDLGLDERHGHRLTLGIDGDAQQVLHPASCAFARLCVPAYMCCHVLVREADGPELSRAAAGGIGCSEWLACRIALYQAFVALSLLATLDLGRPYHQAQGFIHRGFLGKGLCYIGIEQHQVDTQGGHAAFTVASIATQRLRSRFLRASERPPTSRQHLEDRIHVIDAAAPRAATYVLQRRP